MGTMFGTGIIQGEDSFKVGHDAAKRAMERAGTNKVDLSIVFASSKYDHQAVVKGVSVSYFRADSLNDGRLLC